MPSDKYRVTLMVDDAAGRPTATTIGNYPTVAAAFTAAKKAAGVRRPMLPAGFEMWSVTGKRGTAWVTV